MPEQPSLKDQTIGDFGEQWRAFRDNPGYYGSTQLLADLFGPLLSLDDLKGSVVADIGSGTGRIVNMLLDAGAGRVIAVEPSAAMEVMKENTAARADRIEYLEVPGDRLPPASTSTWLCRWGSCITFQTRRPSCGQPSMHCGRGDAA